MYKNDPCYEFARVGMDKLNYKTHILDVFGAEGNNGSYPAKMSDGLLVITSYGGENAEIGYTLNYLGDPVERNCYNSKWRTNIYTFCKYIVINVGLGKKEIPSSFLV